MRAGDLIEWTYDDGGLVAGDEKLWSSTMERWVPIGGCCLLLHIDGERMTWSAGDGTYHALLGDRDTPRPQFRLFNVTPRCIDEAR